MRDVDVVEILRLGEVRVEAEDPSPRMLGAAHRDVQASSAGHVEERAELAVARSQRREIEARPHEVGALPELDR